MSSPRTIAGRLFVTLVLGVGLAIAPRICGAGQASSPEAAQAQQVLEATGIKGGLIVHLGCGDGTLTAALHASDAYLVHGLDADAANVEKAREHIRSLGLYGPVSADQLTGDRLPYIENLVNLVVAEDLGKVPMQEVLRVLAPNGVAYVKQGGQWTKTVKPRPKEIDEWTHYLHDASNNAVAHDSVVGPPRQLQWVGDPKWARHHDHLVAANPHVVEDHHRPRRPEGTTGQLVRLGDADHLVHAVQYLDETGVDRSPALAAHGPHHRARGTGRAVGVEPHLDQLCDHMLDLGFGRVLFHHDNHDVNLLTGHDDSACGSGAAGPTVSRPLARFGPCSPLTLAA